MTMTRYEEAMRARHDREEAEKEWQKRRKAACEVLAEMCQSILVDLDVAFTQASDLSEPSVVQYLRSARLDLKNAVTVLR